MKSRKKSSKKRGLRGLGLLCPAGAEPKSFGSAGPRCVRDGKMVPAVQGPELAPPGYRAPSARVAGKKKASKRTAAKTIKITKSVRVSCGCAAPKAKIRTAGKRKSKKA
jgi:hypothetical protein